VIIFMVICFVILMVACWIAVYERGYKSGMIEGRKNEER